jgi:hypothetical protein
MSILVTDTPTGVFFISGLPNTGQKIGCNYTVGGQIMEYNKAISVLLLDECLQDFIE